jgi:hypothetical protein
MELSRSVFSFTSSLYSLILLFVTPPLLLITDGSNFVFRGTCLIGFNMELISIGFLIYACFMKKLGFRTSR